MPTRLRLSSRALLIIVLVRPDFCSALFLPLYCFSLQLLFLLWLINIRLSSWAPGLPPAKSGPSSCHIRCVAMSRKFDSAMRAAHRWLVMPAWHKSARACVRASDAPCRGGPVLWSFTSRLSCYSLNFKRNLSRRFLEQKFPSNTA